MVNSKIIALIAAAALFFVGAVFLGDWYNESSGGARELDPAEIREYEGENLSFYR